MTRNTKIIELDMDSDEYKAKEKARVEANRQELHPSFRALHEKSGSGYYWFATRVGLGGIFYLSSSSVHVYNVSVTREEFRKGYRNDVPYDFYDVLRALEEGHIRSLKEDKLFRDGEIMEEGHASYR